MSTSQTPAPGKAARVRVHNTGLGATTLAPCPVSVVRHGRYGVAVQRTAVGVEVIQTVRGDRGGARAVPGPAAHPSTRGVAS